MNILDCTFLPVVINNIVDNYLDDDVYIADLSMPFYEENIGKLSLNLLLDNKQIPIEWINKYIYDVYNYDYYTLSKFINANYNKYTREVCTTIKNILKNSTTPEHYFKNLILNESICRVISEQLNPSIDVHWQYLIANSTLTYSLWNKFFAKKVYIKRLEDLLMDDNNFYISLAPFRDCKHLTYYHKRHLFSKVNYHLDSDDFNFILKHFIPGIDPTSLIVKCPNLLDDINIASKINCNFLSQEDWKFLVDNNTSTFSIVNFSRKVSGENFERFVKLNFSKLNSSAWINICSTYQDARFYNVVFYQLLEIPKVENIQKKLQNVAFAYNFFVRYLCNHKATGCELVKKYINPYEDGILWLGAARIPYIKNIGWNTYGIFYGNEIPRWSDPSYRSVNLRYYIPWSIIISDIQILHLMNYLDENIRNYKFHEIMEHYQLIMRVKCYLPTFLPIENIFWRLMQRENTIVRHYKSEYLRTLVKVKTKTFNKS